MQFLKLSDAQDIINLDVFLRQNVTVALVPLSNV